MDQISLRHGFGFDALYDRDSLVRLDGVFLDWLKQANAVVHDRLLTARGGPDALAYKDEADLLIALGPYLEDFIAGLFGVEA